MKQDNKVFYISKGIQIFTYTKKAAKKFSDELKKLIMKEGSYVYYDSFQKYEKETTK